MYRKFLCIFATAALAAGCATESSKTIEAVKVSSYNTPLSRCARAYFHR